MSPEQTRYVIARQVQGEFLAGPVVPMLDLPDAEHVHLTRQPDGTYTAVPMLEFNWRERTADELRGDWWVDAPVGDR